MKHLSWKYYESLKEEGVKSLRKAGMFVNTRLNKRNKRRDEKIIDDRDMTWTKQGDERSYCYWRDNCTDIDAQEMRKAEPDNLISNEGWPIHKPDSRHRRCNACNKLLSIKRFYARCYSCKTCTISLRKNRT